MEETGVGITLKQPFLIAPLLPVQFFCLVDFFQWSLQLIPFRPEALIYFMCLSMSIHFFQSLDNPSFGLFSLSDFIGIPPPEVLPGQAETNVSNIHRIPLVMKSSYTLMPVFLKDFHKFRFQKQLLLISKASLFAH
jgi:hypothetical protein